MLEASTESEVSMSDAQSRLPIDVFAAFAGRAIVTTKEAARLVNRAEQTLRIWAMRESGPIRPVRIRGRLGWRVEDLRRLIQEGAV
jgi:hypothetical protein